MADFDLILVMVAALLAGATAGWLYLRCRHRACLRLPRQPWPEHRLDTTPIANRVHRIRRDYPASALRRQLSPGQRPGLLAAVRKVVNRLAYFRALPKAAANPGKESPFA